MSSPINAPGSTRSATTSQACAEAIMETIPLVMRTIRSEMRRRRGESLSVPQFRVLIFLYRASTASLTEVANHLGVALPTASHMTRRLSLKGLVRRRTDPRERRRAVLTLTPAGRRHMERARGETRAYLHTLIGHLPEGQLRAMTEGLSLLHKTVRGRALEAIKK